MGEAEYRLLFGDSRDKVLKKTEKELKEAIKSKDKARYRELSEKLRRAFVGDDVFWANEVGSNIFLASVLLMIGATLIVTLGLNYVGYFRFNSAILTPILGVTLAGILLAVILNTVYKGQKSWLKYVLMIAVVLAVSVTYAMIGFRCAICLTLPVILSTKYLTEKFTRTIAVVSGVFMLTSVVAYAYFGTALDLNYAAFETGTNLLTDGRIVADRVNLVANDYMINLIKFSFLPNLMQYLIVCYICVTIAKWGHRTFLEQERVAKEYARVDTELELARRIQTNMLPNIFPAFPNRPEVDIYATMDPAKEVGGDFYDFFLIDDDHIGVVMADVSGKGIPAALFMMIGKTLIKYQALQSMHTNEVLERVNEQLCENNAAGLFITAWLGVLELSTGILRASNAGHEYPVIKKSNGQYEIFKDKHGFVLAGMEGAKYKEYEIQLEPGDSIFVYTDGVTEATNADNKFFGVNRMIECLNHYTEKEQEKVLKGLRREIDDYAGHAAQFDDITMLGLKYNGKAEQENTN